MVTIPLRAHTIVLLVTLLCTLLNLYVPYLIPALENGTRRMTLTFSMWGDQKFKSGCGYVSF